MANSAFWTRNWFQISTRPNCANLGAKPKSKLYGGDCPIIRLRGALGLGLGRQWWLRPLPQKQVWGLSSSAYPHPVCSATVCYSSYYSALLQPSSWHRALPHFWLSRVEKKAQNWLSAATKQGGGGTPDLICHGQKVLETQKPNGSGRCVRWGRLEILGFEQLRIITSSIQLVTICRMLGLISCWTIWGRKGGSNWVILGQIWGD